MRDEITTKNISDAYTSNDLKFLIDNIDNKTTVFFKKLYSDPKLIVIDYMMDVFEKIQGCEQDDVDIIRIGHLCCICLIQIIND